jgi:NAD(P)-dependent dehydrogenase (short-subunit alcohol dehydrogenase family)
VVVCGRREGPLKETAARAGVDALVEGALERHGRIVLTPGTVPLGRLGTEEEFAGLVAYLASPAGDHVSGAILTLDGARDNWFGSWPPGGMTDSAGQPLAEEREPRP